METKGDRIRKLREQKGLTQTELADAVFSTKQNIYKYENNVIANIPSDKVEAIAHALNTTPAYIMGWDNNSIINSAVVKGNNYGNNAYNINKNGSSISTDEKITDDDILNEIIRIYNSIGIRGKNRLLSFAYEIEDSEKAKETPT